ncbi:hypothetical protein P691DRAFT_808612 [Macrolepiota fuliginosa MF-IS2]|uniref:F-box domain-containing protein n=1 Tax=Macrolepiota fuliginosa MF-IS2 TaxID=1400762 RepID=A0A9P5XPD0_9AGAR|nr:hypothetical protein P691DRAFT_808612 [Macrolepiota fuliginosa MF-IS2]
MRHIAKPLSSLPELLELIFSYLSDESDIDLIYTCALVSRNFHHSARYFLYAHPFFRHPRSDHLNTNKFIRFRETVISARYGETLRSLTYTLNPKYLVDLLPHLTRLRSLNLRARNQDYHILSRRQPGQLATRLRETLSRHEFSSLKFHGYYVEDGFNTLNYLLEEARGLRHLALSQLKTLKGYPRRPLPCENASPIPLRSLTVGFPQLTRRHARENWVARSEAGYWLADYFGLKPCAICTSDLEELTIVDGGVFETRKIVEGTFASLKMLRLEGNVHLDNNFPKPFTAPSMFCCLSLSRNQVY